MKLLKALIGTAVIILAGCNIGGVEQETIQVTYEAAPVATPAIIERDTEPTATPAIIDRDLDVVTVLAKDAIPAIRSPEFVSVADAEAWMNADEPVIGVEIDDDARAYPVAMLSRHEIVNDTVGGAPLAVTW